MIFRNWVLENFPFLEDDFDSLTDYGLFCKMMGYVKKFAKDNEDFNKRLTDLENYIKNLDLQEEVNNKLDEMVLDGTMAEIINQEIFTELNNKIDNISDSTLNNVVDEIPEEKINNSTYEEIEYEEEISNNFNKSFHELNVKNEERFNTDSENNIIKVASFNIENENIFYTIGVKGVEKYNKLSYLMDKLECDIVGINELTINTVITPSILTNGYQKYITFGSTEPTIGCFDGDYGNGILSHTESASHTSTIYVSHNTSYEGFIKNVYSINDNIISFYCTHFNWLDTSVIQDQLDELYSVISSDTSTYKIIVGDFNFDLTQYETYLSDFLNDGYKLANKGSIPTFSTSAIDEIMVSGNINILDKGAYSYDFIENISDHRPIWAKLELEGNE